MFKEAPFARIVLTFALGIFVYSSVFDFEPDVSFASWFTPLIVIYFLASVFFTFYTKNFTDNIAAGLPTLVLIGLLGFFRTAWQYENSFFEIKEPFDKLIFQLDERPKETEKFWRGVAKIVYAEKNGHAIGRNVMLFIPKSDVKRGDMDLGTRFWAYTRLNKTERPKSENDFDMFTLLARKGIFYQTFLREGEFIITQNNSPESYLLFYADKLRTFADNILAKRIKDKDAYAVATAMFLGIKEHLDEETQKNYSVSGAMHVLAVSGLHVGVILGILSLALTRLFRLKENGKVFVLTILSLIWLYAMLTGFSASVVRASVMFSFVTIGKFFGRHVGNTNSLAASAFFMLLFQPYWLYDVGFLLSYAAVWGIFYYQPKIYHTFYFPNNFQDYLWNLVSVSLAAQISTLPFTFYYFHQFPTYFLLTNLLVIALSGVVLYLVVFVLLFNLLPFVGDAVAFMAEYALKLMNLITALIEDLPFSSLADIHLTVLEAWGLVFLIVFLTLFARLYNFSYFAFACFLGFLLIFSSFWKDLRQTDKNQLIIFGGKSSVLMFRKGLNAVADAEIPTEKIKKYQLGHIAAMRIKNIEEVNQDNMAFEDADFGRIFSYGGKTIVHLKKVPPKHLNLYCNILIVSNNALYKSRLPEGLIPDLLVLDGTNIYNFSEKAARYARENEIEVHNTRTDGIFILDVVEK
jgi:competence protein ComEC